jgi:raffinose/stachyose/melibiose transport system permease protein
MLNSLGAVILVLVAGGMVFNTLLFYGYMQTMPKEIEEAAVIDGASVH